MCVFNGPAHAASTIISLTKTTHSETGRTVHVIGYENTVMNNDHGPNCMILPFPSKHPLGKQNVIETAAAPHILKDMVEVVSRKVNEDGEELTSKAGFPRGATMFRTGIYTVIVGDPCSIHEMVADLPDDVRPDLKFEDGKGYAQMYPKWQIALCCFNNRDLAKATPMMWWYEPMDESTFFVPMLDQHDGKLPDLNAQVDRDHWLIFGDTTDYEEVGEGGTRKTWSDDKDYRKYRDKAPEALRWALPKRVIGVERRGDEQNRDYRIEVDVVSPSKDRWFDLVLPPGA